MKYLLLLAFVLIGFASCQKEITDEIITDLPIDTTITTLTGNFEADIDSIHWVANQSVTAKITPGDSVIPALILINAFSTDNKWVSITLKDSGGIDRSYNLYASDTVQSGAGYEDSTANTVGNFSTDLGPRNSKVGTVIIHIDTVNKTLSGTFDFTAYREVDSSKHIFTNGKFSNIHYTKGSIISSSATDSFHVKINDTLFNADTAFTGSLAGLAVLQASDSSGNKSFNIGFSETIAAGTYSFDLVSRTITYSFNTSNAYMPAMNTGTLQILENNSTTRRVRGNFSFTGINAANAADTKQLTEGYFSVELP